MHPIGIENSKGKTVIIHKCEKCGKIARCRASENDDADAVIAVSQNQSFIFGL
jgi:hypothetical protein